MTAASSTQPGAAQAETWAVTDAEAELLLAVALGLPQGQSPFPWQLRLLRKLRDGALPRSLDIPTGLGKTATIAIWLLARALGAKLPRRLVYVVDRRVVVDQATTVAEELRAWVEAEPRVRSALGLGDRKLPVSTLRGQFVDNREWLDDPSAPAIIVGTVDMVGSRLLFDGYRASRKIRPYLAGLLGHDCLFVLDEAHLVQPFERLLERVTIHPGSLRPRQPDEGSDELRLPESRLLSLSATGRSRGGRNFELEDDDLQNPVVEQRLGARKCLEVAELRSSGDLAEAAAARAWELAQQGAAPIRCIIFLTKRDDAEKAKVELSKLAGIDKLKKGETPAAAVELLVGGRRVFERVNATERLEEMGFLAGTSMERSCPVFLFATSAGEVGVDLDADHMVSDLVSWERMVQRLGRVNRRGGGDARVLVLDAPIEKATPEQTERRESVLRLFKKLPRHESGAYDVSPGALRELQRASRDDSSLADLIVRASTPDPLYPPLDRATLDAWSMTSLKQHPGRPDVAPWLRGWVDNVPQTVVVWRQHLPLTDGKAPTSADTKRYCEAVPIHTSEVLEVEHYRVSEWLGKRAKALIKLVEKGKGDDGALGRDDVVLLLLPERDGKAQWWTLSDIDQKSKGQLDNALEGSEIIVDARFAGLSDGMLDPSCSESPPSLDGGGWLDVPYRVRIAEGDAYELDKEWRERERLPLKRAADGEVLRWLVVEKRRGDAATEDDRSSGREQTLGEHQSWAAAEAMQLATKLGLPSQAARLLIIAARLHDEGKRARSWQVAFHAPSEGGPFAKTPGPVNVCLLDGYRHEFGSLPYAARDPEVMALSADERDLVLHLIASHHGHARPLIPTRGCDDAPPSALDERAQQVALRFMSLQKHWGPWGLAWWESLLRAADQRASRKNDEVAR